jgi:glycosyltransferase involved in cell wall biosynthesis
MGVYNAEEYLEAAVDSILEQTFDDFEFLIVDDASTDESAEILAAYDDSRIRILRNEENEGLTWSLNRALDAARGTYIARQDADDLSDPDRLRRQIEYMDSHPGVAVLGTGAEIIDEDGDRLNRRCVLARPTLTDLHKKNHIIHGSILARRAALEDVGGYDELFRYSQDYDLWLRIAEDYEIRNLPEPLYALRVHDESIYFSKRERSILYALLARGRSTGEFDTEVVEYIRKTDIDNLKGEFSREQRREFHTRLAKVYLRYGHREAAQQECQQAAALTNSVFSTKLTLLLTYVPQFTIRILRDSIRFFLNVKVSLQNFIRRYYIRRRFCTDELIN